MLPIIKFIDAVSLRAQRRRRPPGMTSGAVKQIGEETDHHQHEDPQWPSQRNGSRSEGQQQEGAPSRM